MLMTACSATISATIASAATYCGPPAPPACVNRLIKSAVADEFNACRTAVVAFQTDASRYLECLRQAETDVVYDVEQAILRFNRCANEGFCAGTAR
jgi:hypothetical protein